MGGSGKEAVLDAEQARHVAIIREGIVDQPRDAADILLEQWALRPKTSAVMEGEAGLRGAHETATFPPRGRRTPKKRCST